MQQIFGILQIAGCHLMILRKRLRRPNRQGIFVTGDGLQQIGRLKTGNDFV